MEKNKSFILLKALTLEGWKLPLTHRLLSILQNAISSGMATKTKASHNNFISALQCFFIKL